MRPQRTCAASSSPFTSLSRTAAHEASLDGVILMPYFLSNSITEAITTEEQSVSGMKPILTSFFSGASEPAAHAPTRTASGTMLISPAAPAFFRKSLLRTLIHDLPRQKKRRWELRSREISERLRSNTAVAPLRPPACYYASAMPSRHSHENMELRNSQENDAHLHRALQRA